MSILIIDAFTRRGMDHWKKLENVLSHLCSSIDPPLLSGKVMANALSLLFNSIEDLCEDHPKGPALVGKVLGPLIISGVFCLEKLGELLLNGGFEPGSLIESNIALPLLGSSLQSLIKIDETTATKLFKQSKLDLSLYTLEGSTQNVVEKYNLEGLFPELMAKEKMESLFLPSKDGCSVEPLKVLEWCKSNDVMSQKDFAARVMRYSLRALFPDPSAINVNEEIPAIVTQERNSFAYLLKQTVGQSSVDSQIDAIYEVQKLWHGSGCKKMLLSRFFMDMYDSDIFSENALIKWKDDLRDHIPGKGASIMDSYRFFDWLATAEEEDDEEDEN